MRNVTMAKAGLLVALVMGFAACGGGSDSKGKFIGTWAYAAGTATTTCPDLSPPTDTSMLTGNVSISASSSGADLLYNAGDGCLWKFDVSGTTAMGIVGQMCTQQVSGGTFITTPSNWLLITTDGKTMTESASGSAQFIYGGVTFPCTISIQGTLTKQ